MTREFSIAVIAGDGIGPEVVPEGLKVLSAAAESVGGATFDFTHYDLGGKYWRETGEALSDETLEELRGYDSIFFGAVGDPEVPSGILERGLLLKMRFAFEHYVNLRPTKLLPGVSSPLANPGDIDFVVVREGTEGPYAGQGGYLRYGTEHEVATEVSVNTAFGVERVVRDAFARARARRGKLTYVHKHNVMQYAGHLWRRIVERVAEEFPDVEFDYVHTDACTIYLVTDPARFDVIVTDNLFGDIITDLAAAVTGGIGLAASGNINPDRTAPSLFEPIHGSAPDIAGQGKADPTASVLSASLMAAHLGLDDIAARIQSAAESDLATRGTSLRTTSQIGDALAAAASGPVE